MLLVFVIQSLTLRPLCVVVVASVFGGLQFFDKKWTVIAAVEL